MNKDQCQNCLCASCQSNSAKFDTLGKNVCVGCDRCEDFAVDKRGQCPIGQYEKANIAIEYDEDEVIRYRKLLGISNRIIYASIGICVLMSLFIRNSVGAGVIEGLLLLTAAGGYLMHKKYSGLLTAEACARLPEVEKDEEDEAA